MRLHGKIQDPKRDMNPETERDNEDLPKHHCED